MKKQLIIIMLAISFIMAGCLVLDANTDKDYKVLKKSQKMKKGGTASWLRVSVSENGKEKVMVKVPLALIELFSKSLDDKVDINGKDLKIKEIMKIIKKNGPQTLIEVNNSEENQVVKVWVE